MNNRTSYVDVTCSLDCNDVAFIDSIAANSMRSREYYLQQAVGGFVRHQRKILEEIDYAIAEADAGKFASDEQVLATWKKLGIVDGLEGLP